MPTAPRVLFWVLVVMLAAYLAEKALPLHLPAGPAEVFEKWVSNAVFIGAALLCGWRAVAIRDERRAWMLLSAGLLMWGLGDLYFTLALWDLKRIPVPSPADVGYLALYPLAVAGLVSLFRSRVSRQGRLLWVDGLIGALAAAAIGATVLYGAVLAGVGGTPASVATNIAYPLADLLLAAFVAGVLGMSGWQLNSTWGRIGGGLVIFAITDALYLYMSAAGTYGDGNLIDVGWPLAALVIARAAWMPAPATRAATNEQWRAITFPLAFGLSSLGLLVYDHYARVNVLALWLAAAASLAVLARLGLTFADNLRMLAASHSEAHSDALTGLGNRRALMGDLADAVADVTAGACRYGLAMFDLDGFKHYNDSFGHPAGDALLARLGGQLRRGLGSAGTAYRVGGDEFCILYEVDGGDVGLAALAGRALSERGRGFTIGCSYGSIVLPDDADTAEAALHVADERMYARKQSGRASAGRQSGNVLHQALTERHPKLGAEGRAVAELAAAVAGRLGLAEAEVQTVRIAAELHDIGKVAIPDAILRKPGPLDDGEAAFVRRHTIIGERIVAAAPALADVARIVRSSHESVDGSGYPDGLSGEEIPLASRIVFACDAFHAMMSNRPYARGLSEEGAVAELRRCSATQFDPAVVEACCAVLGSAPREPAMAGAA
jgi:two-component system, cell cycle response regulator